MTASSGGSGTSSGSVSPSFGSAGASAASIAASASESTRDLGEELAELGLVGRGHRRERIEAGQHEPLLVLGEVDVDDGDGRLAVGERLLHAQVAVDEMARALVDDDLGDVSDGVQHLAKRLALGLRMDAPVGRVGEQLVGCLLAGADDADWPRQERRTRQGSTRPGCRIA